jgi:hypothetical protein
MLASRGRRDMDDGPRDITDAAELARIRAQARKVHVESVAAAAALTALVLFMPA